MSTQVHNSETCDADNGTPCAMCRWADEQERRQLQHEPQRVEDDRRLLWADAATIRAAVFDIVDSGDENGQRWALAEDGYWTEDDINRERVAFADALLRRIHELQQLHSFPRLEVLCDTHKRRRLPTYSGECSDCKKERCSDSRT